MSSVDFSQWLDQLRKLPTSGPQWEHAKQFIDDATEIITEKETQRNRIEELVSAADDISERFSGELGFLGVAPDAVSWPDVRVPSDPHMILEAISQLESSLVEFREARSISLETLQQAAVLVRHNLEALNEHIAEAQSPEQVEASSSAVDIVEDSLTVPLREDETSDLGRSAKVSADESAHLSNEESILADGRQLDDESTTATPVDIHVDEPPGAPQDSPASGLETSDRQIKDHVEESRESENNGETQQRHGLEESQVVARRFLNSTSLYDLETLMWTLIAEDDLTGAYWIAQFLSDEKYDLALSPTLLQALQASRWLSPESNQYVGDLFAIVANYDDTALDPAKGLLEFAASLHPSLIAPLSNMVGWLKPPEVCPELKGLVSAVSEYALTGNPAVRPEYITGVGESVRRQDEISNASLRAEKWLADAPMKKSGNLARATSVWKVLTGPQGKITEILSPVRVDDRTKVDVVKAEVSEWDSDAAMETIHRIDQLLEEGKTPKPKITGRARNWLVTGIAEAKEIARHWCELVDYENEVQQGPRDKYLIQRVNVLRDEVERVSRLVVDALSELTNEDNPTELAAAAQCAKRSLGQVFKSLDIHTDCRIPDQPATVVDLHSIRRADDDLTISMTNRLLWTRVVGIDDDGYLMENAILATLIPDLVTGISEQMSLEQAMEQRIGLQDYRFFETMNSGIVTEKREYLESLYTRARQDSNTTLKRNVEDIEKSVHQAVRDGVIDIDDDNWIIYHVGIDEIVNSMGTEQPILNYPSTFNQLTEMQDSLQAEKKRKLAQLQREWDQEIASLSNRDTPAVAAWEEKFGAAREHANVRVMEECVIRIRNHSIGESLPQVDWDDNGKTMGDEIQNFVGFINGVTDAEEYARTGSGLNSLQDRLASIGS